MYKSIEDILSDHGKTLTTFAWYKLIRYLLITIPIIVFFQVLMRNEISPGGISSPQFSTILILVAVFLVMQIILDIIQIMIIHNLENNIEPIYERTEEEITLLGGPVLQLKIWKYYSILRVALVTLGIIISAIILFTVSGYIGDQRGINININQESTNEISVLSLAVLLIQALIFHNFSKIYQNISMENAESSILMARNGMFVLVVSELLVGLGPFIRPIVTFIGTIIVFFGLFKAGSSIRSADGVEFSKKQEKSSNQPSRRRYCQNCGTENVEGATFCINCGAKNE